MLLSVRIHTDSLDDAQRWNVFLRILLVAQLDVQPHRSPLICFIRWKMPSALQCASSAVSDRSALRVWFPGC